jgi:hypothetical protein
LAEPPSELGTGGGQIVLDEWLAAAAVEVAPCVEVFGVSPESCNGTWEVFDDDALKPEALLPAAPLPVDPVADPLDEPVETDPVENDDPVGNDDVGTLSGSEVVPVLPVWSLAVWAWAVVMAAVVPKTMMAIKSRYRIALFSCVSFPRPAMQDNARTAKKDDEV